MSIFYRILNRLSRYHNQEAFTRFYKNRNGTTLRNYIECEAHRELILEGLKQ